MATRSRSPRRAYWLGRMTRRAWRGYVQGERRVVGWLAAEGWPLGGARALLWIVKLGVLAILVYVAFWVVLLLICVVVAVWWATTPYNLPRESEVEEWYFTSLDERRKSPGYDPVPYNDFEHPDFPDEREN